jgi:hypothetical protein
MPLAIPINILPAMIAHWPDKRPQLPGPSSRNQERMMQPTKFKLVASYKKHYIENKIQLKNKNYLQTCCAHPPPLLLTPS